MSRRIFKILENRQPEGPSVRPLLPILSKIIGLAPSILMEDQTNLLSKRLVDWLRYASIQQGLPYSGGFFSTPRTRQVSPHCFRVLGVEITKAPSQTGYVA